MKFQFSLTALLICILAFAVASAVCKLILVRDIGVGIVNKPVHETIHNGTTVATRVRYIAERSNNAVIWRAPTMAEFGRRVAWSGPLAVAVAILSFWSIRSMISRHRGDRGLN